jgi:L-asparaginase II
MANAIIAEVRRGGHLESTHTGSVLVCDPDGKIVLAIGDPDRAAFPRSAIKALQALPLVASGAADRWGLTPQELALACASHTGLPEHTETAHAMLRKAGRDVACLECGTHWPSSASAARALAAAGAQPSALHNNCSGKHAGFVCTAVATARDPAGYIQPDHPTMRDVIAAVTAATGAPLDAATRGVDGCSIPSFVTPLRAVATGFARFATGQRLPSGFAAAAVRLRAAVAAHPRMIAGPGRFDTEVTAALGDTVFVKAGAEGVVAGALPSHGLGFAIKADDGASRAADACAAMLLARFLGDAPVLAAWSRRPLTNWNGITVGEVVGVLPA